MKKLIYIFIVNLMILLASVVFVNAQNVQRAELQAAVDLITDNTQKALDELGSNMQIAINKLSETDSVTASKLKLTMTQIKNMQQGMSSIKTSTGQQLVTTPMTLDSSQIAYIKKMIRFEPEQKGNISTTPNVLFTPAQKSYLLHTFANMDSSIAGKETVIGSIMRRMVTLQNSDEKQNTSITDLKQQVSSLECKVTLMDADMQLAKADCKKYSDELKQAIKDGNSTENKTAKLREKKERLKQLAEEKEKLVNEIDDLKKQCDEN